MEETCDPATIRRLDGLGAGAGRRCLEVGVGGGSIARWLGARVGPGGRVLATDLDVSALDNAGPNVDVRRMDLRSGKLPEAEFDLVHGRLVLGHIAEREQVLGSLIASLRPGGWLLVEEADSFATGTMDNELHAKAMVAALTAIEHLGFAQRWGRKLPTLLRAGGLENISVTCDVHILEGGSVGIEWLYTTWREMIDHGLTHGVDMSWFGEWADLTGKPGEWFVGLSLMAVSGQRPTGD